MHSLRQIELDLRREMETHREDLERRLQESIARSEDSTFNRVEQLFTPQVAELRLRLDRSLPTLHSRIEEVFQGAKQDNDGVVKRLDASLEDLNIEVAGIHAALPKLRGHCEEHSKRILKLEEIKPDLFKALDVMRKESYDWREHIEHEFAHECRRAEAAEAAFAHQMQERLDAVVTMTREFDERATKQTKEAIHTVGMAEKHLLARLDETREFAIAEARRLAAEAAASIRPEIHEIVEMLQKGMDECRLCLETRSSGIEAQIRREMQHTLQSAFEESDRSTKHRITEVVQVMAEGFEVARQDLRAQAVRLTDTADRWREIQDRALDHTAAEAADARSIADQAKSLASTVDNWVALHGSKVDRTFAYLACEEKPWTPTTAGSGTISDKTNFSFSGTSFYSILNEASADKSESLSDSRPITGIPGIVREEPDSGVVF